MREFFRGWRRKAGLVTLAMALVLMAGWFRSHVVNPQNPHYVDRAELFGIEIDSDRGSLVLFDVNGWETIPGGERNRPLAHVHYLPFVLPLTLVSAWLLLTKPRPAKSAKESNHA